MHVRDFIHIVFLTFILIFSSFLPSQAENSLKPEQIKRYLNSLVKIKELINGPESENQAPQKESIPLPNNTDNQSLTPISDTLEHIKNHHTFKSFEKIILISGFSTIEQWADVGDNIMMTYSAYHLINTPKEQTENISDIKIDLSNDLKKIESNKFINPEQKKFLIEKIQNSIALLADPNYINNGNIKIISPYIKRLNTLFEEHQ
jgi:hypothetical protein